MKKILKKSEILALLNLYKDLKHSLYKTYKGNASIPYINSKVRQKCQDFGFFENFFISKKKSGNFSEHLCQSEIFPGLQKSYLETRATRLKMRYHQILVFNLFYIKLTGLSPEMARGGEL